MTDIKTAQLRLVYSLLKPAVAMAARFHVPMRTLGELLRLNYFEALRREGLSQAAVGERLGQTARHMRTLARKLKTDFFEAETEVGLVREVESEVARSKPTRKRLVEALSKNFGREEIERAVATLLAEGRIVEIDTQSDGEARLEIARRYLVLSSEKFHHRIDALNHFLGGLTLAVAQRLLFEERERAMVKTISFVAQPEQLTEFLRKLEANLRREIAALEEEAQFEGAGQRFVLGVFAANEAASEAAPPG